MSDLTVHSARWCASNDHWTLSVPNSKGDGHHLVTFADGRYACTCKGFSYRRQCRHVAQAREQHCQYGWEAAAGSPVPMGKRCPKCGGPTSVVQYAV